MKRGVFLLALVASGCGLDDGKAKVACRDQADCSDGYVCNVGRCGVPGTTDLAMSTAGDGGVTADMTSGPGCSDGVKNGNETDIDCGGSCSPCAMGAVCAVPADCVATTTCAQTQLLGKALCLPGRWSTAATMPTARSYLAAATGSDGRIYALGGTNGNMPLTKVEAYDPKTNSWTVVAPMQKARYGLAAVAGPDGRIYAIGGQYQDSVVPGNVSTVVESYDIASNSWRTEPSLGHGRYVGAAVVSGGRIYAIGGFDGTKLTDPIESFAPGEAAWTASTFAMNMPRSSEGVAVLGDGRIVALGGTSQGVKLNAVEIYDPAFPGWSTTTPLHIPRDGVSAATSKGFVYALSGNCYNTGCTGRVAPDVEVYDATAKQWGVAAPMLTARYYAGVTSDADGKIYVVGGIGDGFVAEQSNLLEVFTP